MPQEYLYFHFSNSKQSFKLENVCCFFLTVSPGTKPNGERSKRYDSVFRDFLTYKLYKLEYSSLMVLYEGNEPFELKSIILKGKLPTHLADIDGHILLFICSVAQS